MLLSLLGSTAPTLQCARWEYTATDVCVRGIFVCFYIWGTAHAWLSGGTLPLDCFGWSMFSFVHFLNMFTFAFLMARVILYIWEIHNHSMLFDHGEHVCDAMAEWKHSSTKQGQRIHMYMYICTFVYVYMLYMSMILYSRAMRLFHPALQH